MSQAMGAPLHTPALQVSSTVHGLLSLQAAPSAYGYEHDPPEQVPAAAKQPDGGLLQVTPVQGSVWQASLTQGPPEQVICCWV